MQLEFARHNGVSFSDMTVLLAGGVSARTQRRNRQPNCRRLFLALRRVPPQRFLSLTRSPPLRVDVLDGAVLRSVFSTWRIPVPSRLWTLSPTPPSLSLQRHKEATEISESAPDLKSGCADARLRRDHPVNFGKTGSEHCEECGRHKSKGGKRGREVKTSNYGTGRTPFEGKGGNRSKGTQRAFGGSAPVDQSVMNQSVSVAAGTACAHHISWEGEERRRVVGLGRWEIRAKSSRGTR